jgi:hypothetical protein
LKLTNFDRFHLQLGTNLQFLCILMIYLSIQRLLTLILQLKASKKTTEEASVSTYRRPKQLSHLRRSTFNTTVTTDNIETIILLDSDEDEQDRAVVEEDLSKAPVQTSRSREANRKNKENRLAQAIYSNRFFTRENNPFGLERFMLNPESYIMDAKTCGNIGRYFNHSCSPNMFVQNVFVDTYDLRFPWIAFFAACSIKAGTELCWVSFFLRIKKS